MEISRWVRSLGVLAAVSIFLSVTADAAVWGSPAYLFPNDSYPDITSPEGFRGVMWGQRRNIPWEFAPSFPAPCRIRADEDSMAFGVRAKWITYTFRNSVLYGVRIDIEGRDASERAFERCRSEYLPFDGVKRVNALDVSWKTAHTSIYTHLPETPAGVGTLWLWGRSRMFPDDADTPVYHALPPGLNTRPKPYKPRRYVAYRASGPVVIDGCLDERAWRDAEWTEPFEDHQAPYAPPPWKTTRAKILYDDDNLYLCAELQEENVWGHLAKPDTIIYLDNDWEIFLNPTADGAGYYEFEINPLNYVWDLFYETDYHRAAAADIYYNVTGLRHAVGVQGTLNYHYDTDIGWTVEVKWPLASLLELNPRVSLPVKRGDVWRVNFSRVQYLHIYDRLFPYMLPWSPCEDWVWQSTNTGDLHNPEMWGKVVFSDMIAGSAKDEELEQAFPILPAPPSVKAVRKDMAYFPPATVTIGPDPSDPKRSPAHREQIPGFRMDRYEVTVAEFAAFLNGGSRDRYYDPWMRVPEHCGIVQDGPGRYHVVPGRENYPATYVTYEAAAAYAASVGKTLPTEAMWERAARGTGGRAWPWGNDSITPERANYDFHYGGTTPVGSFPKGANPEGVYDFCGNVKEWCTGEFRSYPGGEPMVYPGQREPFIYEPIIFKGIARGGAWTKQEACMSPSYRDTHGSLNMGFRCVRVEEE
jgi:formylglycine-generating enzyme required for sulfatase activity